MGTDKIVMDNWREIQASSNVAGIGYNQRERIMRVQFLSGAFYDYLDVPKTKWDELQVIIAAGMSVGSWLNANIKKQYSCEKLED